MLYKTLHTHKEAVQEAVQEVLQEAVLALVQESKQPPTRATAARHARIRLPWHSYRVLSHI